MAATFVVNETHMLLIVDALDEVVMKKCIVDVHLTDRPRVQRDDGEHGLDGG